jgi:hypothetical protein
LNLYFLVTAEKTEIKVTPDAVLRDADFYPLSEFPKMPVNPDMKDEILSGISNHWVESCKYLGNQWKD